jgi:cytochrome c oxidase assembly factor CtaG
MSVSLAVVLILIAYAAGIVRFRRHARGSRQPPIAHMLAMAAALLLIEIALGYPLDEVADRLLSAHMVQHLLLMLAAAPLLVWARPLPYFLWLPPMSVRKGIAYCWNRAGISRLMRLVNSPAVSWLAFCGTVLLWHVPAIYRWAVGGEFRHSMMHLTFLGSALLFWSVVLDTGRQRRLDRFACAVFVLCAALVTGLAGALICFARQPLYGLTESAAPRDGLTVLADQQLAGLIMWIPMDLVLFAVAMALFAASLTPVRAQRGKDRWDERLYGQNPSRDGQ